MTEKTEALRLAEFYEALAEEPPKSPDNSKIRAAAAELRRLAKVEDEWAALSQDQGKLESQIDRLVAQRDELLAALKMIAGMLPCADNLMSDKDIARAAIKAVKGENHAKNL